MARLFIAVWPPDDVVAELAALPRKGQRGVRFVPPEDWHITLRFFGDADPNAVVDALAGLTLAPAVARLGPGVDVLGDRAVIVPVGGLDALAATVATRTARLGERPRQRFVGHLTLARTTPHASMPRAVGAFITGTFDVDEIALVQSRLDPDGARYDTLATWPVGAAAT